MIRYVLQPKILVGTLHPEAIQLREDYQRVYKKLSDSFLALYGRNSPLLDEHKSYLKQYLDYFSANLKRKLDSKDLEIFEADLSSRPRLTQLLSFKSKYIKRKAINGVPKAFRNVFSSVPSSTSVSVYTSNAGKFSISRTKKLNIDNKLSLKDFRVSKTVNGNILLYPKKFSYDLLYDTLKDFSSSYYLANNLETVKELKKSELEVKVLKRKNLYKCRLEVRKIFGKKSYHISDTDICNINKAPCTNFFGKARSAFLSEHECFLNCDYYIDRQKCTLYRICIMRPTVFFRQVILGDNFDLFKQRSLLVVEDASDLLKALKNFATFKLESKLLSSLRIKAFKGQTVTKEALQILIEAALRESRLIEKQGWLNQIEYLRNQQIYFGYRNRFRDEPDSILYKQLLNLGKTCLDGLDRSSLMSLFNLKELLCKIKLALISRKNYLVLDNECYPADSEHLLENLIFPYGKYILILNTV